MTRGFPARLHVLLASKAPVGVVFRRGPASGVTISGNPSCLRSRTRRWSNSLQRLRQSRQALDPSQRAIRFHDNGVCEARGAGFAAVLEGAKRAQHIGKSLPLSNAGFPLCSPQSLTSHWISA